MSRTYRSVKFPKNQGFKMYRGSKFMRNDLTTEQVRRLCKTAGWPGYDRTRPSHFFLDEDCFDLYEIEALHAHVFRQRTSYRQRMHAIQHQKLKDRRTKRAQLKTETRQRSADYFRFFEDEFDLDGELPQRYESV